MKFISLAVMALLGTSQAINLKNKEFETDEDVAAQISAEGTDA